MLKQLIKLIRPKQWVKNVFVLAPLVFSRKFTNPEAVIRAFFAMLCFIAASSAVYILNDILDLEKDRLHETKRLRPLASGKLSRTNAVIFMLILLSLSLIPAFFISRGVLFCIVAYVLMNILYSTILKNFVIVDIMAIALGFVIRVICGAVAIPVYISSWVLLCTFFIALCIGAGKRKAEKAVLNDDSAMHRRVLSSYTDSFLKSLIQISITGSAITYSLYTVLEYDIQIPMITILFVFYGLFRYMQLVLAEDEERLPEEIILSDVPLMASIILFGISWIAIFLAYGL
jgi:4-hydroxybenzoate polyprenyltransferase